MRNPTDQLYAKGIPVKRLEKQGYVLDDIDWDPRVDTGEDIRLGARTGVTQFHYEHLSHVLLCQQILSHYHDDVDPHLHDAASTIAEDALTQVGTWGQYMNHIGGGTQLTPPLQEYYTLLYYEPDPMIKLIGALTIDAADVGVYHAFQHNGDDMFDKIASQFADDPTFIKVNEPLQAHVSELSESHRQHILQKSAQYIDLIGMCVDDLEHTLFEPFGYTADEGRDATGDTVKTFYRKIGLTDGIF